VITVQAHTGDAACLFHVYVTIGAYTIFGQVHRRDAGYYDQRAVLFYIYFAHKFCSYLYVALLHKWRGATLAIQGCEAGGVKLALVGRVACRGLMRLLVERLLNVVYRERTCAQYVVQRVALNRVGPHYKTKHRRIGTQMKDGIEDGQVGMPFLIRSAYEGYTFETRERVDESGAVAVFKIQDVGD